MNLASSQNFSKSLALGYVDIEKRKNIICYLPSITFQHMSFKRYKRWKLMLEREMSGHQRLNPVLLNGRVLDVRPVKRFL